MATRARPRFGELVRRHRTAAALSQEELAERAGLSVRAISDLERGVHRAPRLETVRMVADALGLTEADRADLLTAARPAVAVAQSAPPTGRLRVDPLPQPPTRLIGRETEVAMVSALLAQDDTRLVTLTGAGGTGKTHLALTVAAAVRTRYPDGVCFVDLSLLTDPALVAPTIATALGVRERAGESLRASLHGTLRDRRLLLVLDNCEQVLGAAADIAALLAACQTLEILATSREPLHIRAEREIAVAPLSLPTPGRLPPVAALAGVAAIALFVERAVASQPDFTLTADNAGAVAAICRRLDGLPLAIELAAARIKVLSPAALLVRLEKRLALLTGGGRDLPTRQRTMRDAIAWSYDLLTPVEQELFRRLAIIVGDFPLEAADAVAAPGGEAPVFDGMASLIEHSLLRRVPRTEHEPRFVMLEIVREFGLEMLAEAEETASSRKRHAHYFLGPDDVPTPFAAVFAAPESPGRLAVERDNVRLAFMWLDERGEIAALLGRMLLFYRLWYGPGLYREGQDWVERALGRTGGAAPRVRFRALDTASALAVQGGDYGRAAVLAAEGLALARELGDPVLTGEALTSAGHVAYRQGEHTRAEALLLEAQQGLRERDEHASEAIALLILGDTALAQEQCERAGAWYEEAIEKARSAGDSWVLSDAQAGLGGVHVCTGNLVRAAALYGDSLARAQDRGYTILVSTSLFGFAALAVASGHPETGARLLGAAEETAARLGAPTYPRDNPVRDRALAGLAATLGEHQLAAAREAGHALTVEEAIAEAQAVVDAARLEP